MTIQLNSVARTLAVSAGINRFLVRRVRIFSGKRVLNVDTIPDNIVLADILIDDIGVGAGSILTAGVASWFRAELFGDAGLFAWLDGDISTHGADLNFHSCDLVAGNQLNLSGIVFKISQ